MQLQDYLHLYLPFEFSRFGENFFITGFNAFEKEVTLYTQHGFFSVGWDEFEIPLRPLSDMTEEEGKAIAKVEGLVNAKLEKYDDFLVLVDDSYRLLVTFEAVTLELQKGMGRITIKQLPEIIKYLLSKHFDLFGLIDAGLAIDKTKVAKLV